MIGEWDMREIFNSDSKLMKVLGKLFDIGYLSILFIIFSLPVITIGASLTALYYTTVKVIRRDRGYIFQEFFRSFRLNFLNATILWIIQLLLTVVMIFNVSTVVEDNGGAVNFMTGAYMVMGIIIYAVSCYVYPVLSRFEMKKRQIVRLSLYMAVKHIYFTIPFIVISLAAVIALILFIPYLPIVPLVVPALASLLYSFMMEPVLKKYMHTEKTTTQDGEVITQWYEE